MDVDLLRPGTVPISPDTSLWFEFLLEPSHLEKHLKNPNGDPTPTELITKFLSLSLIEKPVNGEPILIDSDQKPCSKRCIALKILALKVASHLKWNLELFEKSLTMANQVTLLKDFLFVVNPLHTDAMIHGDLKLSELPGHVLFGVFIYHRWVVKAFVNLALNGKTKQLLEPIPEEITEVEAEKSAMILKRMADESLPLLIPAPSCFALPTEEGDPEHNWSNGEKLPGTKVAYDLLMDLTLYLVNRGKYPEARSLISQCLASSDVAQSADMSGLCIAVGVRPKLYSPSLSQQFHECIVAKYINIDKVLEKDNAIRQIPIVYRQGLELDISSEVANGKLITTRDAVAMIRALNIVRTALDGGVQLHGPPVVPSALFKAISVVLPLSDRDKKKLEYYLLQLLATSETHAARALLNHISKLFILSQEQISAVMELDYVDPVPHVHLEESASTAAKSTNLELAALERLVLSSYDPSEIKSAVNKLLVLKPAISWDKLNRNWDVPQALSNCIQPIPSGHKRNYVYILVAKSYELDHIKNHAQAKTLLRNALDEVAGEEGFDKLKQLLSFEVLFIDIHQFHSKWPAKHLDWNGLTERCLEAIPHARGGVREAACLALLNTGAWGPLISAVSVKSSLIEIYVAIARASLQLSQYNGKVSPEAWDKITPFFATGKLQGRTTGRDYRTLKGLAEILEPNALSLVISLLTRLHNVLNDQPPLDLYVQFTHLWPGTIKNASQYNTKQVSEVLLEILEHALDHYPYNLSWLKLMGDHHFVNGHYRSALSSYLEAAAVVTEHFSRPLHRNVLEDHVIKRMIKSCTQLQCHTQAGVLCQLLEETDYSTAFKCFSELNPSDASDSYFHSIWDINILEFLISLHAKRGEHHRKQALVRMIGILELNANNNEEIKREAENIRKSHFLRAMAAQYL